jgi:competence protein ComEC
MSTRFILSYSEYITTHYDIKKISAILAIISSYFYLELAGSPVPAVRSFIAVAAVMLAILFDKKLDVFRAISVAGLIIILFDPYSIFSVSFQLSFGAILALACTTQFFKKKNHNSFIKKISFYFFEVVVISLFAQVVTLPFLIYYFGNISIYGALSNILAIPLTSFFVMPLEFLSLLLMPFGLDYFFLKLAGLGNTAIINIAKFVSDMSYSHFSVLQVSKISLYFAVVGGLIFAFFEHKVRWLGALIFLTSFAFLFFAKAPNLLIDNEGKFFAIYDKKNGLIFSKFLKDSKEKEMWMSKMNEAEFKFLDEFSDESKAVSGIDCNDNRCLLNHGETLILLKRSRISDICKSSAKNIVNLNKKYKLPSCANRILQD